MKTPFIEKLNIPNIMTAALRFSSNGRLAISNNNLVYLDIDDGYINQLFPLLQNKQIKKPNYFGKKSAGAHITVIYPEENTKINNKELGRKHGFVIKDIVAAKIGFKTYYALLVESASLLELRRNAGLPDLLCFKGYAIGFHITIGTKVG